MIFIKAGSCWLMCLISSVLALAGPVTRTAPASAIVRHSLQEGVILRGVPAAYGVCLVVDVLGRVIRMQHEPFHIARTEMEHAGFMVIDPHDRMKVVAAHGIGPFAGRVPNCID